VSGSAGHKHGSAGLRAALPLGNLIYFAVEFLQIPYSPPLGVPDPYISQR